MTRSVAEAFATYIPRKTPSASQRQAAVVHRASVERSVTNALNLSRFIETGSFSHGTGIAGHSDVDLLVSLRGPKPASSDTALGWLRSALTSSFPRTYVRVSRPAVVVPFAGGYETFEVIPGFLQAQRDDARYAIPAPGGGWMETTPRAHQRYVADADVSPGGAKSLARLLKAWKYHQNVPVSSFYLEMRAAQHMRTQSSFNALMDLCWVLEALDASGLASMRDPTGNTGLMHATSTQANTFDARSKTHTAATRARKALDAHDAGNDALAFFYLDLLFGGTFPSR